MKVLITASYLQGHLGSYLENLRLAGFEPVFAGEDFQLKTENDRLAQLASYPAVICGIERYTTRGLESLPKLRLLSRAGVGIDNVDLEAATRIGIAVVNVPGGNTDAVAEHTLAMMLGLSRRIVNYHELVTSGGWTREPLPIFRGKTLGLWGYGKIAQKVAQYASSFGVKIIVHSRTRKANVEQVDWNNLLRQSDYLSLHVPSSPETDGRLNFEALAKMKPTAFLINTSRGKLVPTNDLVRALREKKIAGAALDVFEEEPLGKNPFAGENVILSPHIAGVDEESVELLSVGAAENVISAMRDGVLPSTLLNPGVRENWRGLSR